MSHQRTGLIQRLVKTAKSIRDDLIRFEQLRAISEVPEVDNQIVRRYTDNLQELESYHLSCAEALRTEEFEKYENLRRKSTRILKKVKARKDQVFTLIREWPPSERSTYSKTEE
jgi:hypothetical protein